MSRVPVIFLDKQVSGEMFILSITELKQDTSGFLAALTQGKLQATKTHPTMRVLEK